MISATRETHTTYDLIRFTFDDGTSIAAGRVSSGPWALSSGNGWAHVSELVDAGWCESVHRGPSTYGHVDYYVSSSVVADLIGHPCSARAS